MKESMKNSLPIALRTGILRKNLHEGHHEKLVKALQRAAVSP